LATKTIKLFNLLGEIETFVEFIRELRTYYESYNSCRWKRANSRSLICRKEIKWRSKFLTTLPLRK